MLVDGPDDVAEFENTNDVHTVREQTPNLYAALHPQSDAVSQVEHVLATSSNSPATSLAGRSDGTSAMQRLVQQEMDKVWNSQTREKINLYVDEFEDPGVAGYIRRCVRQCDSKDMSRMREKLVDLLEMMEAATKIDDTNWEEFPPPM